MSQGSYRRTGRLTLRTSCLQDNLRRAPLRGWDKWFQTPSRDLSCLRVESSPPFWEECLAKPTDRLRVLIWTAIRRALVQTASKMLGNWLRRSNSQGKWRSALLEWASSTAVFLEDSSQLRLELEAESRPPTRTGRVRSDSALEKARVRTSSVLRTASWC